MIPSNSTGPTPTFSSLLFLSFFFFLEKRNEEEKKEEENGEKKRGEEKSVRPVTQRVNPKRHFWCRIKWIPERISGGFKTILLVRF